MISGPAVMIPLGSHVHYHNSPSHIHEFVFHQKGSHQNMVFIYIVFLFGKVKQNFKQWHFLPEKKRNKVNLCFYVNDPCSCPFKTDILRETGSQHEQIK